MKKVFFSALACVAFAGSAFASNEVVNDSMSQEVSDATSSNCDLTTVEKTKDGRTRIVNYNLGSGVSRADCDRYILSQLADIEKQGTTVTQYSTCFDLASN